MINSMSDDASTNCYPPSWTAGARLKVMILGLGDRPEVAERARRLTSAIEANAEIVLTDFSGEKDLAGIESDLAIVIGGDGAILGAGRQMGARQIPVLGVNMGRLGYLADVTPDELPRVFAEVCRGECRVVEHLMFDCSVMRDEQMLASRLGLNEVTVQGGEPFSILDLDLYVDSEWATTYSCDGLIISTPVGSTAHSLSAGGPILRKSMAAFVIVPISPHTLTVRPVVDTADRVFEITLRTPNDATWVVVDGRSLHRLTEKDRVVVRRAAPRFKMIEVRGHSYYGTLRAKLGWSGALHNKSGGDI
jgi:NAD+ kinase